MMMRTLEVTVRGGGHRLPPIDVHELLVTDYLDFWHSCVMAFSEFVYCMSPDV